LRYSYFSWELRNTQIKITINYQLRREAAAAPPTRKDFSSAPGEPFL
jgi:hypothetical protein